MQTLGCSRIDHKQKSLTKHSLNNEKRRTLFSENNYPQLITIATRLLAVFKLLGDCK